MTDLWLVDAFTDQPFRGNPAAVCWLDHPVPDAWMQSLAMEMNQAETAFVRIEDDHFRLRWFTPGLEVDLCGHATLASAHFLWSSGRLARGATAQFETRSGRLTAAPDTEGRIVLDFPARPPERAAAPAGLFDALGISRGEVYANKAAQADYLIHVEDPATVRGLAPDFGKLLGIEARGVIVTAEGDRPGIDFISRFFAPRVGVPEDPVTGSAHCCLAPFWASRLGRLSLAGYQASKRGGTVHVRLEGERVKLIGSAVTVVKGSIDTP